MTARRSNVLRGRRVAHRWRTRVVLLLAAASSISSSIMSSSSATRRTAACFVGTTTTSTRAFLSSSSIREGSSGRRQRFAATPARMGEQRRSWPFGAASFRTRRDARPPCPSTTTGRAVSRWAYAATTEDNAEQLAVVEPSMYVLPCYYKSPKTGRWKERIALDELRVGQRLDECRVVEELLNGRTGPKVFCECGIGRRGGSDQKGPWEIVHAMLRLNDRKASVARKRATRLRQKPYFEAYVSRIRTSNGRLEISLEDPGLPGSDDAAPCKVPAAQLRPGQEVVGTIVRVEPYGVLVDVGATRNGLLPIQAVATLYGRFIPKTDGLAKAGLGRGSRVRLQVLSNERQRLALEFPDDVKAVAAAELADRREQFDARRRKAPPPPPPPPAAGNSGPRSVPEATSFPSAVQTIGHTSPSDAATTRHEQEEEVEVEDDEDEDDYDEYDEDRDIEDALGLGTY